MTPEELAAWEKRRRGRNWAILLALLAMVALFFFLTMAKIAGGH